MISNMKFKSVDEYFSFLSEDVKQSMQQIRNTIKLAAPDAKEIISYNMPALKQHGVLVYYAAYENHIGFYPTAKPIEVFKAELTPYKTSKGAVQFTHNQIDLELIAKIVKYRVQDDLEKKKAKAK